jgi:Fe-S oxidoreductase
MSSRLPLVDPHDKEHTYCTYCPKLCRHACPVSTVEGRETTTPWGKMASLHHVAEGNLDLDADVAQTWWACTGCIRCKSFCDHDNEVARALGAGRAEALRAGVAPEAARELTEMHAAREKRAAEDAEALFGEDMGRRTPAVYAPGCTGCVATPDEARAGLAATRAFAGDDVGVAAKVCCGSPLLDAGDRDGFIRAAQRFLREVDGTHRVVFSDPGCLHALAVTLPALTGETFRDDTQKLLHLSEIVVGNLDRLQRVDLGDDEIRYHDPCRLGRGMGIYEPPRRVLARILGRSPGELHQRREHAECSGAGGQLPRVFAASARAIAEERRADHELAGGGVIVSPCPASKRAFEKAGVRTLGFAELVARSAGNLPD